jgi:hypothetical protein
MIRLVLVMAVITGVCFFMLSKLNAQAKKACEKQTTVRTETCIVMVTE